MRSLWLKIIGAFVLVILVGTATDAVLMNRATQGQINRFVVANGQTLVQQTAPLLADYYARTGSWEGVESQLRSPWAGMMVGMMHTPEHTQTPTSMVVAAPTHDTEAWMGQGMMGDGMEESGMGEWMQGNRSNALPAPSVTPSYNAFPDERNSEDAWMGDTMMNGMMGSNAWMDSGMMVGEDTWGSMGLRLLIADTQGSVVADTESTLLTTQLAPAELAAGIPLTVESKSVGTLLAVSAVTTTSSPATDFVREINRSTWVSSVVAGSLALLLGLFLFRQIVSPVRAVTHAAQRIAAGNLEQRVPVMTNDEVGQLAHSFNQMADALALDRQLRRNMTADIAHELRTPLSVMQANLEAMADGLLPVDAQEIASLHDETLLLTRLVSDLRLLSLAEAGQLKLERVPTDLGELVRRVIEPLHVQSENSDIDLTVEIAPDIPTVAVDADRIAQVLVNLVHNALRYTPAGGRITVRTVSHREDDSEAKTGPAAQVEVVDTGSGIAADELPFVFDRFHRADKSRSRASGGSGMGLAIARQLVEAHGGRIWAKSQEGQGTTISFVVPAIIGGSSLSI